MDDKNKVVTILKETALEAELGNLEKRTFLTAMNHKMRVPMNSIMGMLKLLQDTDLSENQTGYVSAALDAAKYLLSLLEEFGTFSSECSDTCSISNEPFDLNEICREIMSYYAVEATSKNIRLDYEFNIPKYITVNGNLIKFQQILAKLIEYAIINTENKQVLLSVSSTVNDITSDTNLSNSNTIHNVMLKISFTGENLLFYDNCDIFSLCESALINDKKQKRLAIELAVCRKIAENMKGTLKLEKDNNSATFYFQVPMTETPLREIEILSEEKDKKDGLHDGRLKTYAGVKVLVAEDDPINQSLAMAFLEKLGATVETADDGIEAVDKFKTQKFDMIFMDCEMPEVDGFASTSQIRDIEHKQNLSRIPIIAMTAYAERGDKERCIASGMDAHVPKPITLDVLNDIVEKFILKN